MVFTMQRAHAARAVAGARRQARPALALVLVGVCAASYCLWSSLSFSFPLVRRNHAGLQTTLSSRAGFREVHTARASRGGDADSYAVGDKVKAICPDDDQWYPGVIESSKDDGSFTVKWDDPDGGPESHEVMPESMKKIVIFKDYVVGDDVKAAFPDDGTMFDGVVAKVNKDGSFSVKWDDPDGGAEASDIKPEDMKKVTVFKGYKVDDVVEAKFPDDGQMYAGTVTKANADGTFQVKWDDSDGGPESSPVKAKDMKYPPIPIDKLQVGQKYKGTVRTVMDFGAFVDIGAEGDGLVHISRISTERVSNVRDYVEEGQEIDVWISGVRDDGKFGLTMVEGRVDGGGGAPRVRADLTPFADISPDEWHAGVVARTAPFGAFVTVTLPNGGPSADGLVHISQIRDGFVDTVENEVSEGQEVKVRIQSVDVGAGKMSLTMKEGFGGGGGGGGGGMSRAPADLSAFEGLPSDVFYIGKVARVAPFGAFVTVMLPDGGATADGLVHITQIRDGFVESVEDELSEGQEVKVRIVSVDPMMGKMGLSMKEDGGS